MNTRIQVEHTVTEMLTGVDLVREQLRVASGLPLSVRQKDIQFRGHALECRINAEDPVTFMPSPGLVKHFHAPGGPGVRVDSHLYSGYRIPPNYDSMIAKIITWGETRAIAIARMKTALDELVIEGISTTISLQRRLMDDTHFSAGGVDIHYLSQLLKLY